MRLVRACGVAVVAALSFGVQLGLVGTSPAGAAQVLSYVGVAEASGLRVSYEAPNYLAVSTLVDVGTPTSQATKSSNGRSTGFASLPYPGDLIVTLSTTAGAVGVSGLPTYPLYVQSNAKDRKQELSDPSGSYKLSSVTSDASTVAAALLGGTGVLMTSKSSVVAMSDGSIVAAAEATTSGVIVAGVLKIAEVHTVTTTTLRAGSKPKTTRSIDVTGASVAGQAVTIGPDGIHAAGQALPVPVGTALDPLNAALVQAGISVELDKGQAVNGGGTSDTVVIDVKAKTPGSVTSLPIPAVGLPPENDVTYRLGAALATVLGEAYDDGTAASPGSTSNQGGAAEARASGVVTASPTSAGAALLPVEPSATPPTPPIVAPGVVPTVLAVGTQPQLIPFAFGTALRWFYLVIVVGGLVGLVASAAWRRKERLLWTA